MIRTSGARADSSTILLLVLIVGISAAYAPGGGSHCQPLEEVVNTGECVAGPGGSIIRHKSGKLLDLDVEATYPDRLTDEVSYHEASPTGEAPFVILEDFNDGDIAVVVDTNNTIVTDTADGTQIDFIRLIKKFYLSHPDVYDFLLIWPNFNHAEGSAHITIKNGIRGIHAPIHDDSAQTGTSKLEAFSFFRNYMNFPADVNARIPGNNDTTMTLIAQEVAHRWGAYVHFDSNPGSGVQDSADLLGRGLAHWCYFANVPATSGGMHASSLEGNTWQDNMNGTFSNMNTQGTGGYSELDQYLMGFRLPTLVADTFVFQASGTSLSCPSTPYTPETDGPPFSVNGTRIDVGINDVIRVEGARIPDATQSPRNFRMAFVLLARTAAAATQETIDRLEGIRFAWGPYFEGNVPLSVES